MIKVECGKCKQSWLYEDAEGLRVQCGHSGAVTTTFVDDSYVSSVEDHPEHSHDKLSSFDHFGW